jgi:hypothetical protein
MAGLGKMLVIFAGLVVLLGLILVLLQRANLPIGRRPGDIVYRGKNTTFYFPVNDLHRSERSAFPGVLSGRKI